MIRNTLIQTAVQGMPVNVVAAVGWPPIKVLHDIVRQPGLSAAVGIYDMKSASNVTRWSPTVVSQVMPAAGVTAMLANITLPTTLTIGGSVNDGDAIGVTVCLGGGNSGGAVAVIPAGTTLSGVASLIASTIAADPILGPTVIATATGPQVTLTAVDGFPHFVTAATGSVGTQVTEVGRRNRDLQVVVWTGSEPSRQAATDPIEALIASLESSGTWLQLPDGTQGRVKSMNDYYIESGSPADLYRRDFHIQVEYGVTTLDPIYSVLAMQVQMIGGTNLIGASG